MGLFIPGMIGGIEAIAMTRSSHQFTDLMPHTTYNASVASAFLPISCVGIRNTITFTTLTVAEGVPQSKL